MDAPNAPNPTNPNAQDQFMDAIQGLAAQNQVQGPAAQAQVQGLADQGPANNNAQVGQNIPVQPPQQPAPAQPVPVGPVVPAPKYFINLKKMQNHTFSVLEIGWKLITSQRCKS